MNPWENDPIVGDSNATEPWKLDPEVSAGGAMPFVNRAIAGTVGAPVDLTTWVLNKIPGVSIQQPVGGRQSIERAMGAVGAQLPAEGQQPQGMEEHIGQGVGEVAGMLLPGGAAVKLLSRGSGVAGSVAKSIMSGMVKHPYVSMASEAAGGAGMGAGRGIAEEQGIESPMGRSALEVGGGLVGSIAPTTALFAPTAMAVRGGKTLLRKISMPFSKSGSAYRAGEFVKSGVVKPEETVKTLAEPSLGGLPPVVQTGEKRLMALYKGLASVDPVVEAESVEKMSRAIIQLEKEMRRMGYGSPEVLKDVTQKRVAAIELGMDKRITQTMGRAREQLDNVPVASRPGQESVVVRTELDKLANAEYAKTQLQWGRVNKAVPVDTKATRSRYFEILENLSDAEKIDVPVELKRNRITSGKKSAASNVKQMQGLRSKMLEVSRRARKEGKWNKARIANEVADAILEDFEMAAAAGITPEIAELKSAIAMTRHYKSRFESGIVGEIRGWGKDGAPAIDPTLTLKKSVGRMGIEGAVDLEKVVVTPEARAATERYLGRAYTDYALDPATGSLSPIKAGRFVKNNEAILDQFPRLREQMLDASKAQELAVATKTRMDARKAKLRDPSVSVSARFLNAADLDTEIHSIFKSPDRMDMARQLVVKANKDTSGSATAGLRAGVVDYMLEKAHVGAYNELGEKTLSGRAILGFTNDPKNAAVLREVFRPDQVARIKRVGRELAKIEMFEKISAGKPDIEMKDFASNALRLFSRITGARVGGKLGSESAGGSLQMAQIFSGRAKAFMGWLTKNRAERLVHDAVLSDNPKLLQALLAPIDKPGTKGFDKSVKFLDEQINLWLAASGQRVWEDILEEQSQDRRQ